MRIEGFVPVKNGEPRWEWAGRTEDGVWRALLDSFTGLIRREYAEDRGWSVVRVGDVDSIRDEALGEAIGVLKKIRLGWGKYSCDLIHTLENEIRAMKSKP